MSVNLKLIFLCIFYIISNISVFGQKEDTQNKSQLGIHYFGELGLRPGIEIDYSYYFFQKKKVFDKKYIIQRLAVAPSFASYFYTKQSSNYLVASKLQYQFCTGSNKKFRYSYAQPYLKLGYLRSFYSVPVIEIQADGNFEEKKWRGTNSLVLGSGIDIGGYINKKYDWLFGFEYFVERTEDQLYLHRFVGKLGIQLKLNS